MGFIKHYGNVIIVENCKTILLKNMETDCVGTLLIRTHVLHIAHNMCDSMNLLHSFLWVLILILHKLIPLVLSAYVCRSVVRT